MSLRVVLFALQANGITLCVLGQSMPPKAGVLADFPVATSASANPVLYALLGRHLPPPYLTEQ